VGGASRPGVGTDLARCRQRVRPPKYLAGLRVQRGQPTAYAKFAAGHAAVDNAVVVEWRGGHAVAVLPVLDRRLPHLLAGLHVEGDHVGIELTQKQHALAHRQAAIEPAAADGGDLLVDAGPALPFELTGLRVQREHVVVAGDDIHKPILHQRRRFRGVLAAHPGALQAGHPRALELFHIVGVDLLQRRVALIGEAATVGHPVLAGRAFHQAVDLGIGSRDRQRAPAGQETRNQRRRHAETALNHVVSPGDFVLASPACWAGCIHGGKILRCRRLKPRLRRTFLSTPGELYSIGRLA